MGLFLSSNGRDAAVADDVVRGSQFGDDFRHLKLAQNLRRPHAVRSAFTHGRIVNTHELDC